MPKKRMPPNKQPILRRKVHNLTTTIRREPTAVRLSSIPLHAVLRRDLTKSRQNSSRILRVLEQAGVGDCAEVLLALGDEEVVQVGDLLALGGRGGGEARGQEGGCCDGLHDEDSD